MSEKHPVALWCHGACFEFYTSGPRGRWVAREHLVLAAVLLQAADRVASRGLVGSASELSSCHSSCASDHKRCVVGVGLSALFRQAPVNPVLFKSRAAPRTEPQREA